MTTQSDIQGDTLVFNTLSTIELTDNDRSRRGSWNSEARLQMLAFELARYMPDEADMLVRAGMLKMAA
jgi:hypothetical protein